MLQNDLTFRYFLAEESEQFSFIKVPKVFFTDIRFEGLSYGAKVLYGLLLDRMSLSKKNEWFDKEGRVYVIYTISSIMEDFRVSKPIAIRLMGELESFGLLEKKRRPNEAALIYMKNFILPDNPDEEAVVQRGEMPENQGSKENGLPEVKNMDVQNMDFQKHRKQPKNQGSKENGLPEVKNMDVHNIDSNKTNKKIREEDSSSVEKTKEEYEKFIRMSIGYEDVSGKEIYDPSLARDVLKCILDIFLAPKKRYNIDGVDISSKQMKIKVAENLTKENFIRALDNIESKGLDAIHDLHRYVAACFYTPVVFSNPKGGGSKNLFNQYKQNDYDFAQLEKALSEIR